MALVAVAGWILASQLRSPGVYGLTLPEGERPQAPAFAVTTVDGRPFELEAARGKTVIVYVMAAWCTTCVPEARALAALRGESPADLEVLVLDVDPADTPEMLRAFQAAVPGAERLHWAFDLGQRVARAYQVTALDTTIVIDGAGRIAYRDAWPTDLATLRQVLEEVE